MTSPKLPFNSKAHLHQVFDQIISE